MEYQFLIDGQEHGISLEQADGKVVAILEGKQVIVNAHRLSPHAISLLIDGKSYLAHVAKQRGKIFVAVGVNQFCLEEPQQESSLAHLRGGTAQKADGMVKAPMPGLVIKVNVSEGSAVNPGDSLVVVEAMKMEHEMRAAFKASVDKIHVKAGQQVDAFQLLVELKPLEDSA